MTVAVILALGTIVFTLFVRSKDVPEPAPISPVAHLEQRKSQIYENLRDLQFEFRLGKLSDADYQKTKLDLQRELAKVLAEIEAVQPAHGKAAAAPVHAAAPPAAKPRQEAATDCPHCGATFAQPMKFCGHCGKAMA